MTNHGPMRHRRAEDAEWGRAPAANFTGAVWFNPLSQEGPLNALGVTFEPGARTGWHWHPEGQVLYIVSGAGRVASRDGSAETVGPGDVVYAEAGDVHWHGATPTAGMTHLSLTTGGDTVWTGEHVTDEEYEIGFG